MYPKTMNKWRRLSWLKQQSDVQVTQNYHNLNKLLFKWDFLDEAHKITRVSFDWPLVRQKRDCFAARWIPQTRSLTARWKCQRKQRAGDVPAAGRATLAASTQTSLCCQGTTALIPIREPASVCPEPPGLDWFLKQAFMPMQLHSKQSVIT